MNESDDRLLSALDALTKPVVEHHPKYYDFGVYREPIYVGTHTVEHPPLLEQLQRAINPSSNSAAGSAALLSARNIINTHALALYTTISAEIWGWARGMGVEPTRDAVHALRRWYVLYAAYDRETAEWHTAELVRWSHQIRNLLDPPKLVELLPPCPVCKASMWTNDEGDSVPHPVVLEYRITPEGGVQRPRASCRACTETWDSFAAIEELAQELTEANEPAPV